LNSHIFPKYALYCNFVVHIVAVDKQVILKLLAHAEEP
jgi:hypothetical protein